MGPVRRLVPDAIRRRYAIKFALVLLVLGLTVAAIGYVGTGAVASSVEERVHADQEALAAHEARNVEQWNERNLFFVDRVATNLVEAEDQRAYLEGVQREETGIHDVHYVDLERQLINQSTNDELHGAPARTADEPWVLDPATLAQVGEELYDDPIAGTADDGTPVLVYGQFLREGDELVVVLIDMAQYADEMISPEGSVGYVVYTGSEAELLFDDDEPLATPGPVVVMDESGASFFEPYVHDEVDFDATGLSPRRFEIDQPGDALVRSAGGEYDDEAFLATAVQVTDDSDWYVVMQTPETEAYGFVETIREYGALASLAGLLVVVSIGGLLGHNTARSIDRLTRKAERMEAGDLEVEFDTARVDSIGRLYGGFATMRDSLRDQIRDAETARERAEQARAETQQINERLRARADEYGAVLERCADGDLAARMDADAENEAMADVAASFNEAMAEIERTVAQLSAFAGDVATASEQVTASSEEVRSASQQVTESTQAISEDAERQQESLASATQEMESLANTTEEIAASSNQVADLAERTAETGRDGRQRAQSAVDAIETLEEERAAVVAEFEALEAEVAQIDDLTDRIATVAQQTNVLALNANIEASRSDPGSDGGFGAVAEEITTLSEDAKAAAEEIGNRVEEIQAQTDRSAREVAATSEEIERVSRMVEDAADSLEDIATYAAETNDGVQEISAATQQQAASTEAVVSIVDEAASISRTTTSEAQHVAAAAEEQTTALTEVTTAVGDLSEQASRLSTALDRFETDTDVDAASLQDVVEDDGVAEPMPPAGDGGARDGK